MVDAGAWAELAAIPTNRLKAIPDEVSDAQAATLQRERSKVKIPARRAKVANVCRRSVDPAERRDAHGELHWAPLEGPEGMNVEVAARVTRKEQS